MTIARRAATPLFLILVLAAGGVGCTSRPPQPLHVVSFELVGRHVVVPAEVNGAGTYSFVIDTGAPHTVLSPHAAEAPGVTRGTESYGVGGFGPASRPSTPLDGVTLRFAGDDGDAAAELPLRWAGDAPAEVFDELSSALGMRFDGILGYDLFSRYTVEIDYDVEQLRLYDPAQYGRHHRPRGAVLPLTRALGFGSVIARVTPADGDAPVECRLALDTGSGGELAMFEAMLERHPIDRSLTTRPSRGMGFGGIDRGREGRVARLRLGGLELRDVLVDFNHNFELLHFDGLIGGGLLRRFRVTVDYAGGRLILEPGRRFAERPSHATTGIGLVARGPEFREYHVLFVEDGSAGSEAGVEVGDVLVGVNGRPARTWRLDELGEVLNTPEERILTLRRGTQMVERRVTARVLK